MLDVFFNQKKGHDMNNKPEFHNLEQGSDEWKKFRGRYCTASKAPDVMGCGYGKTDAGNPYLQELFAKGHDAEALTRPMIEEEFFMFSKLDTPTVTRIVDGVPLLASLDGWCDGVVWECKWYDAEKPSSNANEVLTNSKAPCNWYWQIQHQLLVTNTNKALLSVTTGQSHKTIEVTANKDDQDKLLSAWKRHLDVSANDLAEEYRMIDDQIKLLQTQLEGLKQGLIAASQNNTTRFGNVLVSVKEVKEKKQTPADYVKKNGIELEVYQLDEPVYEYRVTVSKKDV